MLVLARCGVVDAEKLAPKDDKVVVNCEFCSSVYEFTPQEAGVE
ncbi:redox-regulated HSP33 family molecular chaperone [Bradyrhizobium sp. AZCC 1578]